MPTYVVEVDFRTKGELALPPVAQGLDRATMAAEGMRAAIDGASAAASAFTGIIESIGKVAAVGVGLAGAGLMAGIHTGIVDVNASLETTQSSMAAIFNAQGMSTGGMTGALKLAGDQLEKMKDDAAALPGEFSDLANIMKTIMPSAAGMGMKVDDVRKMSGMLMASGAAVGIPMDQVAREAAALMEGRAGADNSLGMRLMGLSGDKAQAFNKMDSGDRIKLLTTELGKYGEAIGAISQTYEVLSSTLKDNIQNKILGAATKPLFGVLKEDMNTVNEWFSNNKEVVAGWAHSFGTRIVAAYEFGKEKLLAWGPILMDFGDRAYEKITKIITALSPIFSKMEGAAKGFFGDSSSIDKIESILKLYAAVKVGQGAAGPIGSMISTASSMAGGGGELLAALGGVGTVAPVAIAGLVGIGTALYALDKDPSRRARLSADFDKISDALGKLGGSQGANTALDFFEKVAEFAGNRTIDAVTTSLELFANQLEIFANQLETLNTIATTATTVFGKLSSGLRDAIFGAGTSAADADSSMLFNLNDRIERGIEIKRGYIDYQSDKGMGDMFGIVASGMESGLAKANENEKKKAGKAPKSSTNIQKVEIVVNQNSDPARLARLVTAEIQNLARHPKVARNAPNFAR